MCVQNVCDTTKIWPFHTIWVGLSTDDIIQINFVCYILPSCLHSYNSVLSSPTPQVYPYQKWVRCIQCCEFFGRERNFNFFTTLTHLYNPLYPIHFNPLTPLTLPPCTGSSHWEWAVIHLRLHLRPTFLQVVLHSRQPLIHHNACLTLSEKCTINTALEAFDLESGIYISAS